MTRIAISRRSALGALAAVAASGGSGRTAAAACVLQQRASIDLTIAGGVAVVPIEVNGVQASFVLDTGAARSVVTIAAVQRLGLTRDQWVGTTMSGIGGISRRANADTRSFTIGGVPLVRHTLSRDTSLTVAEIPSAGSPGAQIDGLLGRDYLSLFDLDLDFAAKRLTLYQPAGCSGLFLPWQGSYAAVPATQPTESAMLLPVAVDGVTLRALLDTGAASSLIAATGMYRLGLDRPGAAADPRMRVSGVGSRVTDMANHGFQSMRIGTIQIDQPHLLVAPVRLTPIADMLLGCDWMMTRRVWISYATRQVFVAS